MHDEDFTTSIYRERLRALLKTSMPTPPPPPSTTRLHTLKNAVERIERHNYRNQRSGNIYAREPAHCLISRIPSTRLHH